jgi:glyoxylase-like metal-dependent hydrolase (beta-lactamase superfamily II)
MPFHAVIVPVTPFQQNCSIVWCETTKRAAVVDPGGDVLRIVAALEETGAVAEKILLTHGHIDHAGGAAELKERLGVPIEGPHRDDEFLLRRLVESGAAYGITEARNVMPDRWLEEGDEVAVGDLAFDVLHCPGHSPGSVAFKLRAEPFAITGDVLFRGSIGRTDLPRASHEALIGSIRNKLLPLGDEVTFLCGHGPTSTIGEERRSNPFLR